jgi:CRP/FNR family transcriptional regulator, cyclic AMP receptor protein
MVSFAKVVRVSPQTRSATLCQVLREDPELAEAVAPARRRQAVQACTAAELYITAADVTLPISPGGIGLLVLKGLLLRRVGIDGRFGAELLGEGDLLRPWQDDHDAGMLPLKTGWSVLEPARVAVLDEEFVRLLANYPELAPCFVARAMQRARNLAVNMAIVHQARVDVRLQMLLWHLAGRWGRVTSDGMALPLRLTHSVLADLVAARRPTVTSALSDLSRRGMVRAAGDRWLLFGEAPGELLDLDEMISRTASRSFAQGS